MYTVLSIARRCSIAFITASILIGALSAHAEVVDPSVRRLTLKDAISLALLNNKSVQIQEQSIQFAKAGILDAQSNFLPQVDATYSYTLNDAVSPSFASLVGKQRKDIGIFTGYKNDNLATFTLNESIYNGGANIATLAQARLDLKVQKEALRATKLAVEFETKRLYNGLLLAYETKRIAQDLVAQAQAHYEEVKARYGQGTASKFDVLQSKVQVSRLIPQLVRAENAIDLIKAEFKKLLSISMLDDIEIVGMLDYAVLEINEPDFLAEAYQRNPDIILKTLGIDVKKWGIEYAKSGWLPQISATASYDVRSNNINNMFNPRHDNWSVGGQVSIALFDGFATKAKVDEAKARYEQVRLEKEDIVDQVAVDIKDACLNMRESKTIIDSQKDVVVEAKEALRLAEVRYVNGVGINLDVFDAQVSLAQVEENLAQGVYDYVMAIAQLDKVRGREFFREVSYEGT